MREIAILQQLHSRDYNLAVSTVASSCLPYSAFHCVLAPLRCGTNKTAQVRDLHTRRAVVPNQARSWSPIVRRAQLSHVNAAPEFRRLNPKKVRGTTDILRISPWSPDKPPPCVRPSRRCLSTCKCVRPRHARATSVNRRSREFAPSVRRGLGLCVRSRLSNTCGRPPSVKAYPNLRRGGPV
jgi:hypothetical protein